MYGAEDLGRFAYAVIVVELAAQLSTIGLKRGLAQQLSTTERPHSHVVADGLLCAFIASAVASGILIAFPQAMYPHGDIRNAEFLLPLVIFGIAGADVALAALAYKHDVRSTVHVRAIVEPWVISIAAGALFFTMFRRDGLILAYVLSVVAGLTAALWRLFRSYGVARGWRPWPGSLITLARQNIPLAAADAIEWFSRRLDIAILGQFVEARYVGIYYVAQQVASMPQKLKTSFDPILAPVVTQKLAEGDKAAVAKQVRQVGFWIIAAQAGIALALGITGAALMGLFGKGGAFVGGSAALAFLLAAEVVAATAAVSEAALVYVARHRNLMISCLMIATQGVLTVGIILGMRSLPLTPAQLQAWQGAGAALGLALALGMASILKARLLSRLLGAPVQGWRWSLILAGAAASAVGFGATLVPEWLELSVGAPAILFTFGLVVWYRGFTDDDRKLFRFGKKERPSLPASEIATP